MRKLLLFVSVAAFAAFSNPSRAQFCPGAAPWVFDDVPASDPFCGYITWAAENGITLGCAFIDASHRLFCPNSTVKRSEMAAFVNRLGNVRVEAVGTGPGLLGGPITTTGTISLASTQLMPTSACASNQIPRWNGSAWTCSNDANSGGTVTSVGTGTGLTGGPITSSGTISANTAVLQQRVTGTCTVGSSITAINQDGTVVCQAGTGGTVTSVATSGGLTGGPIATTGTVSIADAGVTQSKLSAAGGTNGQVLSTDGTNLVWAMSPTFSSWHGPVGTIIGSSPVFVFAGATNFIVIPAGPGGRITASVTGAMGLSAGALPILARVNICYRPSVGAVTEFQNSAYMEVAVTTTRSIYTTSDTIFLGPGTYMVGMCVKNSSPTAISSNDWSRGWAMVTAN